jgi:glycosidase
MHAIYEINPKGFAGMYGANSTSKTDSDSDSTISPSTSDSNPTSAWAFIKAKLPYLKDLGVRGIWMAGYCLANEHFYSVWSVYGTVHPGELDPSLGREIG